MIILARKYGNIISVGDGALDVPVCDPTGRIGFSFTENFFLWHDRPVTREDISLLVLRQLFLFGTTGSHTENRRALWAPSPTE